MQNHAPLHSKELSQELLALKAANVALGRKGETNSWVFLGSTGAEIDRQLNLPRDTGDVLEYSVLHLAPKRQIPSEARAEHHDHQFCVV